MSQQTLHQILVGTTAGDAITDHALLIRKWLRESGFKSDIFSQYIHPSVENQVRSFAAYRPQRRERFVIFHHSIGDPMVKQVAKLKPQILLIYHNITPPKYFAGIDPAWAQKMEIGREQLTLLKPNVALGMGVSDYNNQDFYSAGYEQVITLPLVVPAEAYNIPINQTLANQLTNKHPLLLFVGRLSPNKRQEDLLKLLYFLQQTHPDAHLALIGQRWVVKYDKFIERLAKKIGLEKRVTLTGHLSHQDMVTYFRCADFYISMSEHEGFGKPLIESMHLGLPVLAYASSAIPVTMGDAGILFHHKNYPALAQLCQLLLTDKAWRKRLISRQQERAKLFQESVIKEQFMTEIADILNEQDLRNRKGK